MVIVFEAQLAVTPAGNPVALPIPVAPEVVWVISFKTVFKHKTGAEEAALTVLNRLTCIVPSALKLLQPPVKGML